MDTLKETINNDTTDHVILEPYRYLAKNIGKELRRELIAAFNHWLNVPPTQMQIIDEVVRMLHNASLVIDDIEDGSILRRGRPAAHCVFGTPSCINSANFVYFLALQKVIELGHPDAVKIFNDQMLELHRGQGMDIFWRSSFHCPTEAEYCAMVIQKTGGLFGLAVRLMQLFSKNKANFKPLLNALDLLLQIRDDYANLVDASYHKSKTYAEDLTEGKFSFPIIQAIRAHPEDNQVMSILCQRTTDVSLKQHCVRRMVELGALDYTVDALAKLETECYNRIQELGGNPYLIKFVNGLAKLYRTEDGQLRRHTPNEFEQDLSYLSNNSTTREQPTLALFTKFLMGTKDNNSNNPVNNHSTNF